MHGFRMRQGAFYTRPQFVFAALNAPLPPRLDARICLWGVLAEISHALASLVAPPMKVMAEGLGAVSKTRLEDDLGSGPSLKNENKKMKNSFTPKMNLPD